jgi:hypothetical protein
MKRKKETCAVNFSLHQSNEDASNKRLLASETLVGRLKLFDNLKGQQMNKKKRGFNGHQEAVKIWLL